MVHGELVGIPDASFDLLLLAATWSLGALSEFFLARFPIPFVCDMTVGVKKDVYVSRRISHTYRV
jgi:hypothetical protein